MQRDVPGEGDEVLVAGDEVGVAVDLDEDADLAVGVDVGLHGALGGLAAAELGGLVAEPDAQQLDGLSTSPSVSVSAFLQSIMPAPVRSRRSLTCVAVIVVCSLARRSPGLRSRSLSVPATASAAASDAPAASSETACGRAAARRRRRRRRRLRRARRRPGVPARRLGDALARRRAACSAAGGLGASAGALGSAASGSGGSALGAGSARGCRRSPRARAGGRPGAAASRSTGALRARPASLLRRRLGLGRLPRRSSGPARGPAPAAPGACGARGARAGGGSAAGCPPSRWPARRRRRPRRASCGTRSPTFGLLRARAPGPTRRRRGRPARRRPAPRRQPRRPPALGRPGAPRSCDGLGDRRLGLLARLAPRRPACGGLAAALLGLAAGLLLGLAARALLGLAARLLLGLAAGRSSSSRKAAALRDHVADRLGDRRARADRVVVARDHVLDAVRVAVRVDQADDRDAQALGLAHGDRLRLEVDDEHRVRGALHVLDAAEVGPQLLEVGLGRHALPRRQQRQLALGLVALEVVQALDALRDRLEVRQQAAEPAVVDVRHAGGLGDLLDGVAGLLLGADEQDRAAAVGDAVGELLRRPSSASVLSRSMM